MRTAFLWETDRRPPPAERGAASTSGSQVRKALPLMFFASLRLVFFSAARYRDSLRLSGSESPPFRLTRFIPKGEGPDVG